MQTTNWEMIFAISEYPTRDFYPQIKKKTKDLNNQFTKEDVKEANEHLKSCSVSLVSKKST